MTKIALRVFAIGTAGSLMCLASAGAKQTSHAKAHHAARPAAASQLANSGEWTADTALLNKLAPEFQFDTYALRLPTGLTQVDKTVKLIGPSTLKQYIYAGQKRQDGTFPIITVMTFSNLPAKLTAGGQAQADKLLDNVEHETTDGKPNLVMSSREYGEANGLPLVREYFKFSDDPGKNAPLTHGFHYACIAGTTAICLLV